MGVLTGGTSYHAALRRDSALLVEISARPPQRQQHLIRHTNGGSWGARRSEPCSQADQRELSSETAVKGVLNQRRRAHWGVSTGRGLAPQTHSCSLAPTWFLTLLMHLSQYFPRLLICRPSGWDKGPLVETGLRQRLRNFACWNNYNGMSRNTVSGLPWSRG